MIKTWLGNECSSRLAFQAGWRWSAGLGFPLSREGLEAQGRPAVHSLLLSVVSRGSINLPSDLCRHVLTMFAVLVVTFVGAFVWRAECSLEVSAPVGWLLVLGGCFADPGGPFPEGR